MNKSDDNPRAIDLGGTNHNDQSVRMAMDVVTAAMRSDSEYAWGWHCNIAMAMVDEGVPHAVANHGAARFMRLLANVEPAHELPDRMGLSMAQQANAWWRVAHTLDDVAPGWRDSTGEGATKAQAAIKRLAREPAPYKDSGPHLHVGSSSFESWYSQRPMLPAGVPCNHKQLARDAYAAGMGDPLVAPKYEIKGDAAAMLLREHNDLLTIVGEVVEQGHLTQETQARLRLYLDQPFIERLNESNDESPNAMLERMGEDIGSLRECARAWQDVTATLNKIKPEGWVQSGKSASTAACELIRELSDEVRGRRQVWAALDEVQELGSEPKKIDPATLRCVWIDFRASKGQNDQPYYLGVDDQNATWVLTRHEFDIARLSGVAQRSPSFTHIETPLRVANLHTALDVAQEALREAHVQLGGALEETYRDSFFEAQLRGASATIDMALRGEPVYRRPNGRQLHLDHVRKMHARIANQRTELAHKDATIVDLRGQVANLKEERDGMQKRRSAPLPPVDVVQTEHRCDAYVAHTALDIVDAVRLQGDVGQMLNLTVRALLIWRAQHDPLSDPAKVMQASIKLGLIKVAE